MSGAPQENRNYASQKGKETLASAFEALNQAGIDYCILHKASGFPDNISSDVDCVVNQESNLRIIPYVLDKHGLRVVQHWHHSVNAHYYVVALDLDSADALVQMDFASYHGYSNHIFYSNDELLSRRQEENQFWVLAADLEFGYYLTKKVLKKEVTDEQALHLSELYRKDSEGCRRQIERWWRDENARCLITAAETSDWSQARPRFSRLKAELLGYSGGRSPWWKLTYLFREGKRRIMRGFRPTGLVVAVLGPDGAGKSTLIAEARGVLGPLLFKETDVLHFPLHRKPRDNDHTVAQPHQLPPRSLPLSTLKILFWLTHFTFNYYFRLHVRLVNRNLLFLDRHLVDVLVDPRRYRYGGPRWLAQLAWKVIPKPDLTLLLDAPVETLQSRKEEVSAEESERQRQAYRKLIENMPNGVIIDTSEPLRVSAANFNMAILACLDSRMVKRFGLEHSRERRASFNLD